jgi:hypothetical protein
MYDVDALQALAAEALAAFRDDDSPVDDSIFKLRDACASVAASSRPSANKSEGSGMLHAAQASLGVAGRLWVRLRASVREGYRDIQIWCFFLWRVPMLDSSSFGYPFLSRPGMYSRTLDCKEERQRSLRKGIKALQCRYSTMKP